MESNMLYPPDQEAADAPLDLLRFGDELLTVLDRWAANEATELGIQGELAAAALDLAGLLGDALAPTTAELPIDLGPELDLDALRGVDFDALDLG